MAGEEYDDDFEPDDELDTAIDSFLGVDAEDQDDDHPGVESRRFRSARSRIEDYMERRRLREEDIDFDLDIEAEL